MEVWIGLSLLCSAAATAVAWTAIRVRVLPLAKYNDVELRVSELETRYEALYQSHRRLINRTNMRYQRDKGPPEPEKRESGRSRGLLPPSVIEELSAEEQLPLASGPNGLDEAAATRQELYAKLAQHHRS